MRMSLSSKFGRTLRLVLTIGWDGIGDVAASFEVQVQVPSAYYAISTTRIAMFGKVASVAHRSSRIEGRSSSQNGVVAVDGEAVDAQTMAAS